MCSKLKWAFLVTVVTIRDVDIPAAVRVGPGIHEREHTACVDKGSFRGGGWRERQSNHHDVM